jgi:hypothetical protein
VSLLWQIPDRKHFNGVKIYLGSWFQRFKSIVGWVSGNEPMVRQSITSVGTYNRGDCSLHQAWEVDRHENARDKINPQRHAPSALLPPAGPTVHFPSFPQNTIKLSLIHWSVRTLMIQSFPQIPINNQAFSTWLIKGHFNSNHNSISQGC